MIADITAGLGDVAVVYTPRFLPEIVYEQIFTEEFHLVSTLAISLRDIDLPTYIRVGYSPAFNAAHSELLPELSLGPLSVGLNALATDALQQQGGSAYLPQTSARELLSAGGFHIVPDAPVIAQPVHVAFHIRKKHDPTLREAVKILRAAAAQLGYAPSGASKVADAEELTASAF